MPCNVDGSCISVFSYMTSYTCVSQLFCLTYHVKVTNTLKQDAWVSSYKHTDPSLPHILRTIQLQQDDERFRCPLYFLLSLPLRNHGFVQSVMKDNILWVMCRLILWCLMTVKLKFCTVIVTTTQLLHINTCYLSLSFYYWQWNEYNKRKKVVNRTALMTNQARISYSKYGLCMKIFYRNSCLFRTQRNVTWWSHNPMAGWPEIWDVPSTENNKICIDGLNGVWGSIRLYL
jgi:hypothetical protein